MESFSILRSCLAFSLASAFSSFLASTIWGTSRVYRESIFSKSPQTPTPRERSSASPTCLGKRESRRGTGQGNRDRLQHVLRKLIRPGSHFRTEVLNHAAVLPQRARGLADPNPNALSHGQFLWFSRSAQAPQHGPAVPAPPPQPLPSGTAPPWPVKL